MWNSCAALGSIVRKQWLLNNSSAGAVVVCEAPSPTSSTSSSVSRAETAAAAWGLAKLPFVSSAAATSKGAGAVKLPNDPNRPLIQRQQRVARNIKSIPYRLGKRLPEGRERIVVLGTGWSSLYFLQQIDPTKYDVVVISPRSHFVFTPLLTAALGGVLSTRAVMEPIRNKLQFGGKLTSQYLEGRAQDLDLESNEVVCTSKSGQTFRVPYDKLICCIGSETNTFGIPGVKEHASFLKEIEDAREIRLKIFTAFEKASTPGTSEEEIKKLLNFVIVGGGPAGVEAAAEIQDMIAQDMKRYYPNICQHAKVTLIEMLPKLIPMFDSDSSAYTMKTFNERGINCLMEHRVCKIDPQGVHVVDKAKNQSIIPFGFVLWASGVGQVDFAKKIMDKIPNQAGNRVMRVKPTLQVIGAHNVYGLGDCAWVTPPKLADRATELYQMARNSKHGAGISWLRDNAAWLVKEDYVQLHGAHCDYTAYKDNLAPEEFKEMLLAIDKSYKPPIPTALMARQAGAYLGAAFNQLAATRFLGARPRKQIPYAPTNYGHMSYIGGGRAVIELVRQFDVPRPRKLKLNGPTSFMWHGYYWLSQTSVANRTLSLFDYSKKHLRGRDIAETSTESTGDRNRQV